jgi:hypothetical protein
MSDVDMKIPCPTADYMRSRILLFDENPRYFGADATVKLVFEQWPYNSDPRHILTKVVVLNRLYSTGILNEYAVAEHIMQSKIDSRLVGGDLSLVNDVAGVSFSERKISFLSFSSKYCAWHQPDKFQIFDSFVEYMLWEYQSNFTFSKFRRKELRDYTKYVQIVGDFCSHFGLSGFSRKEVDKFLWIEARELLAATEANS